MALFGFVATLEFPQSQQRSPRPSRTKQNRLKVLIATLHMRLQ
jgi:hypothetical protein